MTLFDAFSFYSLPKPFFNFFLIFQTQAKRTKKNFNQQFQRTFSPTFPFTLLFFLFFFVQFITITSKHFSIHSLYHHLFSSPCVLVGRLSGQGREGGEVPLLSLSNPDWLLRKSIFAFKPRKLAFNIHSFVESSRIHCGAARHVVRTVESSLQNWDHSWILL